MFLALGLLVLSIPASAEGPAELRALEARLLCEGLPPAILAQEGGVWRVPSEAIRPTGATACDVAVLYDLAAEDRARLSGVELEARVDYGQGFVSFVRGEASAVKIAAIPSMGAASVVGPWPALSGGTTGFTLRLEGFTPEGEAVLTSRPQRFQLAN